jgi:translation elongation factor EF-Tu-like GTPase
MLELVEMEVREILEQYEFEDDTPIIRGSALGALNGVEKWPNLRQSLLKKLRLRKYGRRKSLLQCLIPTGN